LSTANWAHKVGESLPSKYLHSNHSAVPSATIRTMARNSSTCVVYRRTLWRHAFSACLTGLRFATETSAAVASEFWGHRQRQRHGSIQRLTRRQLRHGGSHADRGFVCGCKLCDGVPGRDVELLHAGAAGPACEHPIQRPAQQWTTLAAGAELCRAVIAISEASAMPCGVGCWSQNGKRQVVTV